MFEETAAQWAEKQAEAEAEMEAEEGAAWGKVEERLAGASLSAPALQAASRRDCVSIARRKKREESRESHALCTLRKQRAR